MQKIEITYDLTQNRTGKRMQVHTRSHIQFSSSDVCTYTNTSTMCVYKSKMEAVNRAEDASYLHIDLLAFRLNTFFWQYTLLLLLLLLLVVVELSLSLLLLLLPFYSNGCALYILLAVDLVV